ncbi:hypothetical protein MU448_11500 [Streptococcus sp. O1]|nr:hypothetical protein [Streptococcus sp. O1]MCQ9214968.1 hypothetical protein [Streptococcus sp. O1]
MAELGDSIAEALAPILEIVVELLKQVAKWFSGFTWSYKTIHCNSGRRRYYCGDIDPYISYFTGCSSRNREYLLEDLSQQHYQLLV